MGHTQNIKSMKTECKGQMVVIKQEKDQDARLAENTCNLADLTEGQVAKLGKVQLLLDKGTLDYEDCLLFPAEAGICGS